MLQQDAPDDFVIAMGEQHSVREFVEAAAAELGIAVRWEGSGRDEKGIDRDSGKVVVAVDAAYFRPTEVETLLGDPAKAKEKLGWQPKTSFKELVAEMAAADLEEAKRDHLCRTEGFKTFNYNE